MYKYLQSLKQTITQQKCKLNNNNKTECNYGNKIKQSPWMMWKSRKKKKKKKIISYDP